MKLIVFVPCGSRRALLAEDAPPSPPTPSRAEEIAAPISPAEIAPTEKRRRRTALSWRPSLGAISEDGVLAAAKGGERVVRSGSTRSRSTTAKSLPRNDRDDVRRVGIPAVLPAFAPTAFIF